MRGFTLIEVLLAAMILVVAIGAGVAVEKGSIKSGVLTRHRTQAVGLAQEGQNLVRSIRDSSILSSDPNIWVNLGGDNPSSPSYKLQEDIINHKWSLVDGNEQITFPANDMVFTRDIIVARIPPPENLTRKITVKIGWTDYGKIQTLEQVSYLTNP
ncbi:MAG: prepilin-type N-terminal cleavage/methylation domain-containing protein [Patescibacteria group bacterium]